LFSKWIAQHNKKYNHENFFYRYTVFKHNMDHIVSHNKKGKSYTMAMNAFGDMTGEEFKSTHTGYNRVIDTIKRKANSAPVKHIKHATDDTYDWRKLNAVTPVKNQQQCGSCWAFSATGSTEGAWALSKKAGAGKLVSVSEQQLVDCSGSFGNQGCNGGLMDNAFQYIVSSGGICTEAAYPYTAQDGTCKTTCKPAVTLSKFQDVAQGQEDAILPALAMGPVSIAIEADQQVFQFYSGGVMNDPSCGTNLDHGVLIVGNDNDATAGAYWIVKNSWGSGWGLEGYVYLARGVNQCGLAAEPSYPIV